MNFSKKEYVEILAKYHALGDSADLDNLISMIGIEFKDHLLRDKIFKLSQKIEQDDLATIRERS